MAVLILIVVLLTRSRPDLLAGLRERIAEAGAWGPILYMAIHASRGVTWIPGNLLSPLGGVLFGFGFGLLYTWIGLLGACAIAFGLVRVLRPRERSGPLARRFERLMVRYEGREWLAILLARLVPGIPFNVTSYLAGATKIGWGPYLGASAVGVLPRMAFQVALGAGLYGVATL